MKHLKLFFFPLFAFFCFPAESDVDDKALTKDVSYVIENLDKATFQTVRTDWTHDYGLEPDTGMLNTYEYLRSLVSYEHLRATVPVDIYIKGPHGTQELDLTNLHSFGHYNPKFVMMFHKVVKNILRKPGFVRLTKADMQRYGIIKKLERLKWIYYYIEENNAEFQSYLDDYTVKLKDKTWPQNGYKDAMPEKLDSTTFWNWSEMVYHFWLRREIDGTKELWIEVINDILLAYENG